MKSIILIAAPAAGKGTEAAILKNEYNLPHISTGDILREKSKEDSDMGRDILNKISNGIFVSDELIIELLKERIQREDCANGYILDGFPRNVTQAESYDEMLNELKKDLGIVIIIDTDKEIAKARIEGRRSCPKCGKIYNLTFEEMKPKNGTVCDECGVELFQRPDDNGDTYEERYNTYIEKTSPLINYYEEKGVVYHVDGSKGKDYTHEQVNKILGEIND